MEAFETNNRQDDQEDEEVPEGAIPLVEYEDIEDEQSESEFLHETDNLQVQQHLISLI